MLQRFLSSGLGRINNISLTCAANFGGRSAFSSKSSAAWDPSRQAEIDEMNAELFGDVASSLSMPGAADDVGAASFEHNGPPSGAVLGADDHTARLHLLAEEMNGELFGADGKGVQRDEGAIHAQDESSLALRVGACADALEQLSGEMKVLQQLLARHNEDLQHEAALRSKAEAEVRDLRCLVESLQTDNGALS